MTTKYEVVAGTRNAPGQVLKAFTSEQTYKCGGPATACLRWFERQSRQSGTAMFFRKVS